MRSTSMKAWKRMALCLGMGTVLMGCAAAEPTHGLLAQRGGTHCNSDGDCHVPLPQPRVCPHGGQSTATACCRMNYCGVCWSDCPAS